MDSSREFDLQSLRKHGSSMRRDDLYLNDIVEAANHIAEFLRDASFEEFRKSEFGSKRSCAEAGDHPGGCSADL
jgi:hypothetical protein